MDDFRFLMITNDPAEATQLVDSGVDRLFVDLEILGKEARQGHLDTVVSKHSINDVRLMAGVKGASELLVRINPVHENSRTEIDAVIDAGADIIMLPMFKNQNEIDRVVEMIDGRTKFCPLIETLSACDWLCHQRSNLFGIDEVYFGLNDLHLELDLNFMFATLLDSRVAKALQQARDSKLPFGFGGMAPVESGQLNGFLVAALHHAFRSSRVILSRTFRQVIDADQSTSLVNELTRLRDAFARLSMDHELFDKSVEKAFETIRSIEAGR
jgi:hypothetical protein